MKIRIEKYRKYQEGFVKGSCDITLFINGFSLFIREVKVVSTKKGGHFYSMPSKQYVDKETGEKKWMPYISLGKKEYRIFFDSMDAAFKEFFKKPNPPVIESKKEKDSSEMARMCEEYNISHNYSY